MNKSSPLSCSFPIICINTPNVPLIIATFLITGYLYSVTTFLLANRAKTNEISKKLPRRIITIYTFIAISKTERYQLISCHALNDVQIETK